MTFERVVPEAVGVATGNAEAAGFRWSSRPEVGRLLRTLASTRPEGRIEGAPDSLRMLYLTHPDLHSVEVWTSSDSAVVLAVHR